MITKLQSFVYYLTLFSFILQTGKHFWPYYTTISGARIDYLAPTIYFSDICIASLFIIFVFQNFARFINSVRSISLWGIVLILVLIISSSISLHPAAAMYGMIKVFELSFFAIYTAFFISPRTFPVAVDVLSWSAILVSAVSIIQYFLQHNIGGAVYYLGERTFTHSSGNIALINENGLTILRPYGTFPHPNVLAFFLLTVTTLIIFTLTRKQNQGEKFFLLIAYTISTFALILTYSRVNILLYVTINGFIYIYYWYTTKQKPFLAGIVVLLLIILATGFRFNDLTYLYRDWMWRQELITITTQIIRQHLWLGTGLYNTFYYQTSYQHIYSPNFLQPVHNIYLHILAQTGIAVMIFSFLLIIKTLRRLYRLIVEFAGETQRFYAVSMVLLTVVLTVGLFDHYLITLQQGQLLTAFILGISWSTWKK